MGSSDTKWPSGILSPWWSCAFTVEMNPNANAESATLLSEPSLAENVVIFARPFESLRIGGTNDSTVGGESDFSAHRRIPRSCRNSKFQVVRAPRHLSTVQTYSASRPSKPVSISIAYVTTVQSPPRQAPHPHQPGPLSPVPPCPWPAVTCTCIKALTSIPLSISSFQHRRDGVERRCPRDPRLGR